MALAALSVDLIAKFATFEQDLGKAARASEKSAAQMSAAFGAVKTTLAGLAAGISVGAIVSWVKTTNQGVDALNDLRDATGASIENISALEDVAARTGTSFETVSTALIKFNKALSSAKPGSDAEAAFKAIGLSAQELKDIDPAEALLKTAIALQGFADDGSKARLTQELFGKSLKEVAPLLKDLAEKGKLVATVTAEQAAEAEKLSHALSVLAKNGTDSGRALLSSFVPALAKMLETFNSLKSSGLLTTGLGGIFSGSLSKDAGDSGKDINSLLERRTKLQDDYNKTLAYEVKFKGQLRDGSSGIQKDIDATNKLLAVARVRQISGIDIKSADSNDAVSRRAGALKSVGEFGTAKADKIGKEKTFNAGKDALDGLVESLRKQLETSQQLSEVEKTRNLLAEKGGSLDLAEAGRAISLSQQIDAQRKLNREIEEEGKARISANAALIKHIAALQDDNNKQAEANQKAREALEELGLTAAQVDTLRIARQDANIEREQELLLNAQSIEGNELEIGQIERRIRLMKDEREIASQSARKKISVEEEDANKKRSMALANSIEDGMMSGWAKGKTLADIFAAELQASFARIVLRPVIEPVAKAASQLIDSGIKALFGGLGLPSFAVGSDFVPQDMVAQIHRGERIIPAAQNRPGAIGGMSITINQAFAPGTTRATTMQAAADASRQLQAAGRNM